DKHKRFFALPTSILLIGPSKNPLGHRSSRPYGAKGLRTLPPNPSGQHLGPAPGLTRSATSLSTRLPCDLLGLTGHFSEGLLHVADRALHLLSGIGYGVFGSPAHRGFPTGIHRQQKQPPCKTDVLEELRHLLLSL